MSSDNRPVRKKKFINPTKLLIAIVFILYMTVQVIAALREAKPTTGTVTLQELNEMIDNKEIDKVEVTKSTDKIYITKTDGTVVDAVNPKNDTFVFDLMKKGVNIDVRETSLVDAIIEIIAILPVTAITLVFLVYLMNTVVGGNVKIFTVLKHELNNTTFDDIKGLGKTKDDVKFIVNQMKNWKELNEVGARPCKGALFYGPPGTGKTMLARAIAKEAGVSFISASGSDFNEMFVGVGAARVRALWDLASANVPCIVFIDEIDCLGKRRNGKEGHSENNQTLNALLQRMDGINDSRGVMVIAATNRKEDLDSALLRPGRLDRQYYVGAPSTKKDRDEVVDVYLSTKRLDSDVTLEKASKLLVGFTGAEIEEALNEAVYVSLQDNRNGVINLADIDEAAMQMAVGGVRREQTSDSDREITAIHEAGHALEFLLNGIKLSKVSIIPYSSGVGGVTMRDPDQFEDKHLKMISDFEKDIKISLAGMIAEEIQFGEHSQGCSNDLEKVTKTISEIVTKYGFIKENLLNTEVLISYGLQNSIEQKVLDKYNELLEKYSAETYQDLFNNRHTLFAIRDKLLENKVLVEPTLDDFETQEAV